MKLRWKNQIVILIVILAVALGLTTTFTNSLYYQIDLLEIHSEAMKLSELTDSDSISISKLINNINNLQWKSTSSLAISFIGLFILSIFLFRNMRITRDRENEGQAESALIIKNRKSVFGEETIRQKSGIRDNLIKDLSRNQLIQFSVVSFIIMFILAVSISTIVSSMLDNQLDMLASHGEAMMRGNLEPTDPFSIPNMIEQVGALIITVVITIAIAFAILFFSLVTIFWRGGIERKQLEANLRLALAEVESIAMTDSLTGLLNRRAIQAKAEIELDRARRRDSNVSFILFDIDKFKQINDKFGHLLGDQALKLLSENLKLKKRPYDSIGRWGGDEFMVVLPGTNLDIAVTVAERIKNSMSSLNIGLADRRSVKILVSLGISSTSNNKKKLTMSILLNQADQALYEAKKGGRHRIKTFSNI